MMMMIKQNVSESIQILQIFHTIQAIYNAVLNKTSGRSLHSIFLFNATSQIRICTSLKQVFDHSFPKVIMTSIISLLAVIQLKCLNQATRRANRDQTATEKIRQCTANAPPLPPISRSHTHVHTHTHIHTHNHTRTNSPAVDHTPLYN